MAGHERTNIHWHSGQIRQTDREQANGHRGAVIWFTGLPASGKSTLAVALEKKLFDRGCRTYILDGDNIRHGLNRDLGFSPEDRTENIRRIGEVAHLFCDCGVLTMVAFISPYQSDRRAAREAARETGTFIEVFVDCPLATCEQRDPKGMYRKARDGEIREFTGISAPYEVPEQPEIYLDTGINALDTCVDTVIRYLEVNGFIPA
ncbi:MAG: adenylyl-sulfate kinase [Thermodesulfobacteriota bacterium]|nr:adenylyl-sulfate kinase [Thermodesulfobacteriota bacterium]